MRRLLSQGALFGLIAAVLALLLWLGGALTPLERLTWQWRLAWFADRAPSTPIVLIALDQASLDWGQRENGLSWPWPREAYRPVIDFCKRAGARAVAFDLIFSEPSVYGVADDQALAAALQRLPTVGAMTLSGRDEAVPSRIAPLLPLAGTPVWPAGTKNYPSATFPAPEIAAAYHGLGNVSAQPEDDSIYRRVALLNQLKGQPVPSLPLALLLAVEPQLPLQLEPGRLQVGGRVVPLDANGQAILRFHGPAGTFPTLSAAAVIQSELRLQSGASPVVDPARLRGAYVIFGLIAPGLLDLRATPLDGVFPGMEIHATALDNLLTQGFLQDAPLAWTVLLTLLIAVPTGMAVRPATRAWQTLPVAAIGLPLPLLLGFVAFRFGWWLPIAPPLMACAGALTIALLVNYATEGRQRRFIKQAFIQYLHPTVIEQLLAHPERLRLGGERREISIFFSDLQGFSGLSEKLDPEALTTLLNDYLTAMTDIILDSGGTIDKYEGDAIIAFWNAPVDQPDHAVRAVAAALACQARLDELRPALRARAGQDLHMRIGINTGFAVVGNMGSQRRFDYTMLGDAVNLASRLEGVNKEFGTRILLSEATRRQLDETVPLREIACVGVVGRNEPVRIFEPLTAGIHDGLALEPFAAALSRYYAGEFGAAAEAFDALAATDPVARRYAQRCRELAAAPPAEWAGVWRLSSK